MLEVCLKLYFNSFKQKNAKTDIKQEDFDKQVLESETNLDKLNQKITGIAKQLEEETPNIVTWSLGLWLFFAR